MPLPPFELKLNSGHCFAQGVRVENLVKVSDWVDVLTFQTSFRLDQPEPPTPRPTHTGREATVQRDVHETPSEKRWRQMGQPSGSSAVGRGQGEPGFDIMGSGVNTVVGDTDGSVRLTPTEQALQVSEALGMPVFNTRSGCEHRGWNANTFDQRVESARYDQVQRFMWDYMLRGAVDCAAPRKVGAFSPFLVLSLLLQIVDGRGLATEPQPESRRDFGAELLSEMMRWLPAVNIEYM